MITKALSFLSFTAVMLFILCLPVQKLSAQAQGENSLSSQIDMVINAGTSDERWLTSANGVMETVALRPNEPLAITLNATKDKAGTPVGITPLDGGEIIAEREVFLDADGLGNFTFKGGDIPGRYRVLIFLGSERYQLQFYVDAMITPGCVPQ
jgi:hypothetical protein